VQRDDGDDDDEDEQSQVKKSAKMIMT